MNKKILKRTLLIIFFSFAIALFMNNVDATYINISLNKTNANPGETIMGTVSSDCVGRVNIIVSNGTFSNGSNEDKLWIEGVAQSFTVTVGNSGTTSITAVPENGEMSNGGVDVEVSEASAQISIQSSSNENNSSSNENEPGRPGNSTSNSGGTNNAGNSSGNSTNKSSDANLTNLGIRPNDFTGFLPNQTSYSVDVPNDVTTIEVYAGWKNGQTVSGIGTKSLKEGANTFNVVVTAADGVTTKTYTVTVNRQLAEENQDDETASEDENSENTDEENTEIVNGNSVFGLSKLQINGIELDPEFSTEVYEYTAKLIGDKESVEISTEATEDNAKVEITGNEALKEGENIITILVTNEAGDKTAAYQIKLTKSLVDEEALARERELEQEQRNRRIILIACAVVFILVVVIILIWRHRRNKRLAEEYSIPYQGFNDDDEYDDYDNNFNKQDENTYEKISDKFDEDDEWYNRDLSKQDETTDEEQISENEQVKIDYNQQMEDEYEEDENSRESLREQYLNQSFDNDIDFDNKSKKRHSKGKRFK